MKNNPLKKTLVLFTGIIALLISLPINTAKAAVGYPEYHPQDLIGDESLYNEVIVLTIKGNEINSVSQIDLSRIANLKEIIVSKTAILDGSILDIEKTIDKLLISNSVVNISTFDLNDFDKVWTHNSYNIGERTNSPKVANQDFINEEYQNEHPDYKTEYEDEINEIAMSIYESSNKTPQDIIRLVTLYVIENLTYDHDNLYTNLPIYDSILNYHKGVCVHYSDFESRLLNKLGVFAISTGGCVDKNDCAMNSHAWVLTYINDNWYYIDPTWLDDEDSIAALKNTGFGSWAEDDEPIDEEYLAWLSDPLKYYLQSIDNQYFNNNHYPDFTSYNLIPISDRVSKISIITINDENSEGKNNETLNPPSENESIKSPNTSKTSIISINDENSEEKNNETLNPPSENESIKSPNTGLFTPDNSLATVSIALIIFATSLPTIFLLITIINRIIRKIKVNNF